MYQKRKFVENFTWRKLRPFAIVGGILVIVFAIALATHLIDGLLQQKSDSMPAAAAQPGTSQPAPGIGYAPPPATSGGTAPVNVEPIPPQPPKPNYPLLHMESTEAPQHNMPFTMELCERTHPQAIQCWGFVSNMNDETVNLELDRAQVVDDQGNNFSLNSSFHEYTFETGRKFDIPGGSRIKYFLTIPDKDSGAKHLTIHVLASNLMNSFEYTFKNVPIAGAEQKAPSGDGAQN